MDSVFPGGPGSVIYSANVPSEGDTIGPGMFDYGNRSLSSSWEALRDCELRMQWLVLST